KNSVLLQEVQSKQKFRCSSSSSKFASSFNTAMSVSPYTSVIPSTKAKSNGGGSGIAEPDKCGGGGIAEPEAKEVVAEVVVLQNHGMGGGKAGGEMVGPGKGGGGLPGFGNKNDPLRGGGGGGGTAWGTGVTGVEFNPGGGMAGIGVEDIFIILLSSFDCFEIFDSY
ncbi:Hypothetical predicted protein, partial [Paramuricea clavata]